MTDRIASPPTAVATPAVLSQLDFHSALDIVSGYAVSDVGKEAIRARLPSPSLKTVESHLTDVAEMMRLLDTGDKLRPVALPDVRAAMDELEIPGSVPDGAVLAEVGACLLAIAEVGAELDRVAPEWPRVGALRRELPPPPLGQRFAKSFEPDGSLKDNASPALAKARRAVRKSRGDLIGFLEGYLRERAGDVPGESNVTQRNGRYVVPVRREGRGKVKGIVHGESGSGATLFVEPGDAVALGNDLSASVATELREVHKILRELSELVRAELPQVRDGFAMCVALDDLHARARYAKECHSVVPTVVPGDESLTIRQGRHPLLLADLPDVVPFDLATETDARVIVVSGPNTGGKTVLLKAVGVLSALAQAGVVPPVGPGTTLPAFTRLFCDIGDHQSIAASLSTFSGHLQALKGILESADATSLVLLDELGTGTDPNEGAALAGAAIQTLCERRSLTIATTHLGQLKELAVNTPGAANASLQFDPDQLAPTYRFSLGIPGRSYGLAIAENLGFPAEVLAAARGMQSDAERSLDDLLADLEVREQELKQREEGLAGLQGRLTAEREGLEALKDRLSRERQELDDRKRALEVTGREEARRYLLDARKRVDEALAKAQGAVSEAEAKEARRMVEAGVRAEGDALDGLEALAKKQGWTVRGKKGRVIRPLEEQAKRQRTVKRRPAPPVETPQQSSEIDLRGMTGDEAEEAVLRAVDGAVVADLGILRIIHGKGTGALRQRVTEVLKRDGRVASHRVGGPNEGSWGVTVAEFKR